MFTIKQITANQVKTLLKRGILKNTNRGFVNSNGEVVGYSITKNKRYIEDKYIDILRE